jgi:hypothetical protein
MILTEKTGVRRQKHVIFDTLYIIKHTWADMELKTGLLLYSLDLKKTGFL